MNWPAFGLGPREPVLTNLEQVARAAAGADPSLDGRGEELAARLAQLLSIAPINRGTSDAE